MVKILTMSFDDIRQLLPRLAESFLNVSGRGLRFGEEMFDLNVLKVLTKNTFESFINVGSVLRGFC